MLGPGQHQRRVDLVADHPRPVPHHDVTDPLELLAGVDVTARVVRLGQQQRPRAVGEQPVEVVEVEHRGPGVRVHRQVPPFPPGDLGDVELRVVGRERQHHRSRVAQHVQSHPHPRGDVDRADHVRRVEPLAEVPRREAGVRLAQPATGLEHRITRHSGVHRVEQRLADRRRQGVVHLRHPRRQHVRLDGAPLEDDRAPCLVVGQVLDHGSEPNGPGRFPAGRVRGRHSGRARRSFTEVAAASRISCRSFDKEPVADEPDRRGGRLRSWPGGGHAARGTLPTAGRTCPEANDRAGSGRRDRCRRRRHSGRHAGAGGGGSARPARGASTASAARGREIPSEGHAAALKALAFAARLLQERKADLCLVGGVDSWIDRDLLYGLNADRRLKHSRAMEGFVPGEAAAFLAVETTAQARRAGQAILARITGLALAEEKVGPTSDEACLGLGLSQAIRAAVGGTIHDRPDRPDRLRPERRGVPPRGVGGRGSQVRSGLAERVPPLAPRRLHRRCRGGERRAHLVAAAVGLTSGATRRREALVCGLVEDGPARGRGAGRPARFRDVPPPDA